MLMAPHRVPLPKSTLHPNIVALQVRQIDCVTVKGSNQPLGLFCYDLDLAAASSQLAALAAAAGGAAVHSSSSGARMSGRVSAARGLQAAAAAEAGGDVGQKEGANSAGGLPAVGRIRHSLAVLPDDASAARSSVVLSAGHNSWRAEEQSGPDPAEVRYGGGREQADSTSSKMILLACDATPGVNPINHNAGAAGCRCCCL